MTKPNYPPNTLLVVISGADYELTDKVNDLLYKGLPNFSDYIFTEILSVQVLPSLAGGGYTAFVLYKVEQDYITPLQGILSDH